MFSSGSSAFCPKNFKHFCNWGGCSPPRPPARTPMVLEITSHDHKLIIKNWSKFIMEVMFRKSFVLEIQKIQTNKTFMASKHFFKVHFGVFWSNFINIRSSFRPFNFIKQKAWFEMFARFNRNQTYRIFLFLYSPLAIHRNFSNWHHIWFAQNSCFTDFHIFGLSFPWKYRLP